MTIASSITSARAASSPANATAFIVAPVRSSVSAAATNDTGTVIRRITTGRQRIRNAASASSARMPATMSVSSRLSMPCSMYVAGRNTVVLNVIPARPGCISLMAASVCRVTSSVLAPGAFSITNIRPGPLGVSASPISGG